MGIVVRIPTRSTIDLIPPSSAIHTVGPKLAYMDTPVGAFPGS
jgi:hypothetical protein